MNYAARWRSFDHGTLEAIRLMAVERVREGERASAVISSYGFNRTTIYKWLAVVSSPGKGVKALRSRPATGRPRTLTPRQEKQVFAWVNGKDPRQYGLDFGLWTRAMIASLIEQKLAVKLGLTAVGELLAKLGLTPQKPLERAYQRNPEAIEKWKRETFPSIASAAKAAGGEVYFWDESGFRADTVHGKTWGKPLRLRRVCGCPILPRSLLKGGYHEPESDTLVQGTTSEAAEKLFGV
jgi:transposase